MQVERLTAGDYEEAIDFINMVFSMAHSPIDFAQALPRLYKPTDEHMGCNFVVRENGRIRALVGLYPDTMQVGDVQLRLAGIGAVSAHPADKGRGWMKQLMLRQMEEMRQAGYDLSFLGGQRQRYRYFGYEKAGMLLECHFNGSNMKHAGAAQPAYRFSRMQATDLAWLEQAKTMHDAAPVRCVRPIEAFHSFLVAYGMQPWAILREDGSMAGYLVASPEKNRILELHAEADALTGILVSWFSQHDLRSLTLLLPAYAEKAARHLGMLAEDIHLVGNGNWQILNWEKVVEALLRARAEGHALPEGMMRLGIQGVGCLEICVSGDAVTCRRTDATPELELDACMATRILLGHVPAAMCIALPKALEPLFRGWFPLPLSWLPQNYV